MRETLDADAVRLWCASSLAALRQYEDEINELNVYPVPDGDTGTNLVFTVAGAAQALQDRPAVSDLDGPGGDGPAAGHPARALGTMARGALLGARGNSGVIVSQLLRGLADALAVAPTVRGRQLGAALGAAARAGYAAVAEPVEGTILSVASAAAAAGAAADSDDLGAVVCAAADAAAQALARTPQQLAVLAEAGVVDAGGYGLVVLLDSLVEVVTGAAPRRPRAPASAGSGAAGAGGRSGPGGQPVAARGEATVAREMGSPEYGYEVQYLLEADPDAVVRLRTTLAGLGDSLVVVGAGSDNPPVWKVHVHVNDVGAAIEAAVTAGRPYQISVTRFADQIAARPPAGAAPARGAVVAASGAGLVDLFAGEGAVVVAGRPSTAEVLAAVRATGAAEVVVLPNDPDTQAVARAAAGEAGGDGIRVSVVPTRSPVQALAALAVRDPLRSFDDDVIAMAEAAGACRYAEVCRASRDALTVAGRCRAGDVLALVDGEVHLIGADLAGVCRQLLDRLLGGGGELVSLVMGADAPDDLAETLTGHLTLTWPFVEVQVHHGGQPIYPLLLGVE